MLLTRKSCVCSESLALQSDLWKYWSGIEVPIPEFRGAAPTCCRQTSCWKWFGETHGHADMKSRDADMHPRL